MRVRLVRSVGVIGNAYEFWAELETPFLPQEGHVFIVENAIYIVKEVTWLIDFLPLANETAGINKISVYLDRPKED